VHAEQADSITLLLFTASDWVTVILGVDRGSVDMPQQCGKNSWHSSVEHTRGSVRSTVVRSDRSRRRGFHWKSASTPFGL